MQQSYGVVACTPHPGFGTVSLQRGAIVRVVDLATCRETAHRAQPPRFFVPGLTARRGRLLYRGRVVYREPNYRRRGWPLMPLGVSPDRKWVLFALDPYASASILSDGVPLRVVSATGGRTHVLPRMLLGAAYRTWCGGRLVLTAGGDRIAWHDKRLVVTAPPDWKPRRLVDAPGRAWGASACAPDGRSVVVQSQRESMAGDFWAGSWALWRVGLDGRTTQLTRPPHGSVDESPRFSRDGRTLLFVRSQRGRGQLYALRAGRVIGPLLSLGFELGYYGAHDWWQSMTWSLAQSR